MTKAEIFEEIDMIMKDHSLGKPGAYDSLLKYIFDCFNTDQMKELLNHIKEEMGENES